jgi:hypothetical protein
MEIITSLFEGHYHLGIAALINSAANGGFKGEFWIGYKGELPPWISQLSKQEDDFYILNTDIKIRFEKLITNWHFGYYKPVFLKELLSLPGTNKIYYFDPDIVINCPWTFYSEWVESGVSLCLDNCFPLVTQRHPWRKKWRELAGNTGVESTVEQYVNSGFIGLQKDQIEILTKWIDITKMYEEIGGNLKVFEKDGFRAYKGDQDLLNAAITVSPNICYSIIGKEGMGFSQPAYLMLHAVDSIKPWRKKFVSLSLKGNIPSAADKAYWSFAKGAIQIYSNSFISFKNFTIKLASFVGRFYSKN